MEIAHHVGVGTFEDLQQDRRPLDPTTPVSYTHLTLPTNREV